MNSEAENLSPRRGDRLESAAFAAVIAYLVIYLLWLAVGSGNREAIGDAAFLPLCALAALAAWRAGERADGYAGVRWGWRLISLSVVVYFVGDVAQLIEETGGGALLSETAAFYIAESLYIVFYPLFLAGILCFPWGQKIAGRRDDRALAVLDASTIAIAGAAFVWYVVLGRRVYGGSDQDVVENFFAIANSIGDLILIVALARLWLRARETGLGRPLYYLALALALFIASDLAYTEVTIDSTYSGGSWVDIGWMIAIGLFTVAAVCQPTMEEGAVEEVPRAPAKVPVAVRALPFAGVAAVFAMLIGTQIGDTLFPGLGLTLTAALVAALLSARQVVGQRSLAAANRELRVAHDELAALQKAAARVPATELAALVARHGGALRKAPGVTITFGLGARMRATSASRAVAGKMGVGADPN